MQLKVGASELVSLLSYLVHFFELSSEYLPNKYAAKT